MVMVNKWLGTLLQREIGSLELALLRVCLLCLLAILGIPSPNRTWPDHRTLSLPCLALHFLSKRFCFAGSIC